MQTETCTTIYFVVGGFRSSIVVLTPSLITQTKESCDRRVLVFLDGVLPRDGHSLVCGVRGRSDFHAARLVNLPRHKKNTGGELSHERRNLPLHRRHRRSN